MSNKLQSGSFINDVTHFGRGLTPVKWSASKVKSYGVTSLSEVRVCKYDPVKLGHEHKRPRDVRLVVQTYTPCKGQDLRLNINPS